MKRLILTLLSILVLNPATAKEKVVELDIPSMTCPVCPITIKAALKTVDGVSNVETSLTDKIARITFDDEITDIASLEKTTAEAGYPSTVKQENNNE
ncbi:Mercuric transport protein periplasmic component [Vibrio crassostreae]|uniref:mercury resistance system periplasmic binding protein MerP n=1 Tax=Vibrio crassostreae TaxID=246167 RepID=UPI001B302978|nr:mercury resistance system periplasmic binding protein MerP [Vibrio crassostreae]CAK2986805.1 Mercuric transport protein periplasmic component [Vibrio crassostreae]CAK3151877.1 Mercuric transport protein periplasmic component [Vibrio crassostreae]